MNINTNIRFGLSMYYEYFSSFERFTDIKYNCSFDTNTASFLRNEKYAKILKDIFVSNLSHFKNVNLFDQKFKDYSPSNIFEFSNSISNENKKTKLYTPFLDEFKNSYKNYIVINTKIMHNSDIIYWNMCRDYLKESINKSNILVLLIGEKHEMKCREYDIHGAKSIYEDLLKIFLNIKDLTVNCTQDLYEKNILTRNLNLLNKSLFNVHIGHGGGQSVFCFLNNLITPATNKDLWFLDKFEPNYKIEITPEFDTFKKSLDKLLI